MSRPISAAIMAAFRKQESGYALPVLLEITHGVAGYDNPLRIVNNTVDLAFGGNVYTAFPFLYDPPDQKEDGAIQNARIKFCTIDQQIAGILRSTEVPPTVVATATYWTDESGSVVFDDIAAWSFTLRNVSGTVEVVQADLIYEDRLDNEYPVDEFRPEPFPGLF